MTTYHCEYAALPGGVHDDVLIDVDGERIASVRTETAVPDGAVRLTGLTLPGLANAHSHAFHRALRGRTHGGRGDFWSWREQMYTVAACLDPDSYLRLARAVYAEMALAGVTVVGEFHYLHRQPDGRPYDEPNAMGHALVQAAADAGVRLTLLDTCYLQAGPDGRPLAGPQLRFTDGSAEAWAARVAYLRAPRVGAAVHSVRACPPAAMTAVGGWAQRSDAPLHFHLSEQRRENEECLAAYGRTPAQLVADAGLLDGNATAVHATHLTGADIALLGGARTYACFCPTTERDLGDGIGQAQALVAAGAGLCLGSDSHAHVDLLEEARAVELHERLAGECRGVFGPAELLQAAAAAGYQSLGWPDGGVLAAGALADLTTVRLDSVRLAGAPAGDALLAAVLHAGSAADVASVVVAGEPVVVDGVHLRVPDTAAELDREIRALFP
ncbi:MAG: formimidoylglutamate deiminase [Streptosporangiales bacterium]|nr:formimidoylglutamate deiminase [Streptosporangiales bacterium]